jgi:hypothetical protein
MSIIGSPDRSSIRECPVIRDGDLARQGLQHLRGPLGVGTREAHDHPGDVIAPAELGEVTQLAQHVAPAERIVVDEPDEADARMGAEVAGHRLRQLPRAHHDHRNRSDRRASEQPERYGPGRRHRDHGHQARGQDLADADGVVVEVPVGHIAHDGDEEAADQQCVEDVPQVGEDTQRDAAGGAAVHAVHGEDRHEQGEDAQIEDDDRTRGVRGRIGPVGHRGHEDGAEDGGDGQSDHVRQEQATEHVATDPRRTFGPTSEVGVARTHLRLRYGNGSVVAEALCIMFANRHEDPTALSWTGRRANGR